MSNEEAQISTAPEIQNPAPESTDSSAIVEAEATDPAAEEQEAEAKPEKTAEQKELEYLRRKATKADRNNARLYQEVQTYREQIARQQPQGEPVQQKSADPYEIAREIAAIERIADKSNSVADEGKKRFPDFSTALNVVIEEAGPLIDPRGRPTALGEAILDADKPADLLHFLGTNPHLADELSGLSPTQLGRRIERIEAQMNTKPVKPASSAPAPIKPLSGIASNTNVDLEKTNSMAEYVAIRKKQGARWAR